MKRDIKFRYWDKVTKKMCEVGQIDWDKKTISPKDYIGYTQSFISFKQAELMEYTGLKDKNGLEIYEGDIVKNEDDIVQIIYNSERSCFTLFRKEYYYFTEAVDNIYDCDDIEEKYIDNIGFEYQCQSYEVIGNIWENPELLESIK